jgi:hypothetical protein
MDIGQNKIPRFRGILFYILKILSSREKISSVLPKVTYFGCAPRAGKLYRKKDRQHERKPVAEIKAGK